MNRRTFLLGAVVGLLLVAGFALVLFVLAFQREPIPLGPPSGELGFISNRDGQWDVFTLDADGNARNLTDDGGGDHDYFVSWAFDSEMMNFITSRSGEMGPGQVRPDGSDLRSLDIATGIMTVFREGRFDWDPAWSPDGSYLLWASLRDTNLELYVAPSNDLESRTRLTSDGLAGPRDWFHAWSPDGSRIVFSSDRDGNENIYVMNADGSSIVQLTDDPADDFHGMWSLDGTYILFVSEQETSLTTGTIDLFVINPDGSDLRPFGENEVFEGDPMYSADGQHVAYVSNVAGDWNIYVMEIDGENIVRVTESDADDMFPVWRPVPLEETEN